MKMIRALRIVGVLAAALLAGVGSAAAAETHANNSGVLHVQGEWNWCENGKGLVTEGTISHESADQEGRKRYREKEMTDCDRVLWQSFRVPPDWTGRVVDVRRTQSCPQRS